MKLKLDDFLNGQYSRSNQKASAAATKKAKNKARNARRKQLKKEGKGKEMINGGTDSEMLKNEKKT